MDAGGGSVVSRVRVVLVTVPDAAVGKDLARRVVEEGLAACGNVLAGLVSVYRWRGGIQEDPEALVIFKTTEDALPALEKRVVELHPYEVPEFLALPLTHGHLPYLQWVAEEVDETDGAE
jgi:periplasmic divalent cation tolerance protein